MKTRAHLFRKIIVLLILFAFLANEGISFLSGPKIKSLTETAVYQFNESSQAVPFAETETISRIAYLFFLLFFIPPFFRVLKAKVAQRLIITVEERNCFYTHVTIHAP